MSASTPRLHEAMMPASGLVQIQSVAAIRAAAESPGTAPVPRAVAPCAPPDAHLRTSGRAKASDGLPRARVGSGSDVPQVQLGELVGIKTTKPEVSGPVRPGVQLGEIRDFRIGDKHYVFVIPVTGIFQLDQIAAAIIRWLRPEGTTAIGPREPVQVPASHSVPVSRIVAAFRERYLLQQILRALAELRSIGALAFVGFPGEQRVPPAPKPPPLPFPQRTLVLNMANDCNLGCTYCFASQGDYGAPKRLMSEETARKSVDFLLRNSGDTDSVSLVFFGGEPLMNLRVIQRTVAYAQEAGQKAGKRVDFSMTTNATYLTPEVIRFLNDNRIGVAVSIDGPKEYHDKRRTFKNGRGSYDFIEPRILDLLQHHKSRPVAARVTLTHGIIAVQEIFWHLKKMGFYEVGFAPVTSSDQDDYALKPEELWTILSEFRDLTELYVAKAARNEYLGFSNLSNLLSELHAGIVKAYPCGAGLGLLGVGATGELYLCHRFLESQEHLMGSLDHGIDFEKQAEFLARAHLSRKTPCQVCWVRHICSGGCHHEAYTRYGDMYHGNTHYCEWIRSWIDLGVRSYMQIMDSNPGFINDALARRGA